MDRFYLEKLVISGKDRRESVIEFKRGINMVLGPRNTGKSLIMECMNYVLGLTPEASVAVYSIKRYGYTKVSLYLATSLERISLQREVGLATVKIVYENKNTGDVYSNELGTASMDDEYLRLLGISDTVFVRSSERSYNTRPLSWKSMLHLFFLKENDVARKGSPLLAPERHLKTESAATLLFLVEGKKIENPDGYQNGDMDECNSTGAITSDVRTYIHKKMDEINNYFREQLWENPLSKRDGLYNYRDEIEDLHRTLSTVVEKSEKTVRVIYEQSRRLLECETMGCSFVRLMNLYRDDRKRLKCIINGADIILKDERQASCELVDEAFLEKARIELRRTENHLSELTTICMELNRREKDIEVALETSKQEAVTIEEYISKKIRPQIEEGLDQTDESARRNRYIESLNIMKQLFLKDLHREGRVQSPKESVYDDFDDRFLSYIENRLSDIVEIIGIQQMNKVVFRRDFFDVEIAGQSKSDFMYGGLSSILNTLIAMLVGAYLLEENRPTPVFFAVDSPLTKLSDKLDSELVKKIRSAFIVALTKESQGRQIIVFERTEAFHGQEIDSRVNCIEFSGDIGKGRYGFIDDVYGAEYI